MTCRNRNNGENWTRSTLYLALRRATSPDAAKDRPYDTRFVRRLDEVDEDVLAEVLGRRRRTRGRG